MKKIIITLLAIISLFIINSEVSAFNYAWRVFDNLAEFEKMEWPKCQLATDGCNDLYIDEDWLVSGGSNRNTCTIKKEYSCKEYRPWKHPSHNFLNRTTFIENNKNTCKVANDWLNDFNNVNWEFIIATDKHYTDKFTNNWTCKVKFNENQSFNTTTNDNFQNDLDSLNEADHAKTTTTIKTQKKEVVEVVKNTQETVETNLEKELVKINLWNQRVKLIEEAFENFLKRFSEDELPKELNLLTERIEKIRSKYTFGSSYREQFIKNTLMYVEILSKEKIKEI